MLHRLGARQDFSYFSFWVYTFPGTHRGTLTVINIHWLPQPDFLKLAAKITLPRLGAPPLTLAEVVSPTPLEEMTIMDFRHLTQPHDLRSQLGLAMSPEPDLLKGSTSITIDVRADEPSRLSDQLAKMIAERAVSGQPYIRTMHIGGPIKSIDKLNEAERFYGEPVDPSTMKPYANAPDPRTQDGMKSRLDDLDEQTLALLIDVGNRPGHDRRRVDAARTQFELAFMMLKRAIEEG